jgi:transcriptional regulator with XRE-family HTH domain
MNASRETVNNRTVLQIMKARGVTQVELGDAIGYSQSNVSHRLAGRVRWGADELYVLARLCGVSMETFFRPVTIDIRDATMIGEDIPGYHNQGLSPGVRVLKRVA